MFLSTHKGAASRTAHAPGFVMVLALVWACVSCATPRDAAMPGMVYSRDGKPLQGVAVVVDGMVQSHTDANGRFVVTHPLLELQRERPWQMMDLPDIQLVYAGYRTVRIGGPGAGPGVSSPQGPQGPQSLKVGIETLHAHGPALWCSMSSARNLLHDAWKLMECTQWDDALKLLEEAALLSPSNKTIRESLLLCTRNLRTRE